ncbi:uncharacterized protein LOC105391985 [Plutella xylostella]|uniref:uncharacterized protein LOC105391985 n=1 Tax=Plutella xylostella TaxID=51655 RepID=UPI0020327D9F|nr:uncharacterized protein LOC105391985 [Plutella xylostella]
MYKGTTFLLLWVLLNVQVDCITNSRFEKQCVDYYSTGNPFDLGAMEGQWNAVYFWPATQRRREFCQAVQFVKLTPNDIEGLTNRCGTSIPVEQTAVSSSYTNIAGVRRNITYYGSDEAKHGLSDCDKILKYMFLKINDEYVLLINCSANGLGILLSRKKESIADVEKVVDAIEIMSGRQGSANCL